MPPEPAPADRQDRRKVRTRAALVTAAQRLIREGRDSSASIQTITDLADVGFGSFYNHFESKEELFDAAVIGAMDDYLAWLDERLPDGGDPVVRLFESVRLTGRLATELPETAAVLSRRFALVGERADSLGIRMRADVLAAMTASTHEFDSAEVNTLLVAASGAMQAVLSSAQSLSPEATAAAGDVLAYAVLRLLSIEPPA